MPDAAPRRRAGGAPRISDECLYTVGGGPGRASEMATVQWRAAPFPFRRGHFMTRRSLALAVSTFVTAAVAACAQPTTAPQRSQLAPAGASSKDTWDPSVCRN